MYEAVTATPDGESTVRRFAATAARQGFDGVVVRNTEEADPAFDATAVREAHDVDVVDAAEIVADDPTGASGPLSEARRAHTVLCVRGGTPKLNRFAAEEERVDVLTKPMAGRGDVNHVIARAAADHDVRVEFDLGDVLRASGGPRVQALRGLRKLRELVEQYDVPYVVSGSPRSHLQMRAPRELRALGEAIGFDAAAIEAGLAEWGVLAERNRRRRSADFIAPGLERGRHDTER
ncbi:ribonuclease P/MRP protein subunit RPP1 [Halarchaeum solikamskense]|uniref:RNase P subunit p30 family protein n=1 Tax=Halarchaeum nitratireducens TaxID=489913 RepID=UPI001B3ACDD4|nr:RNase P subunit p30 family protein [Halarchaeum solikamskense]MBP2250563.1 ribonuclease P/MRP protein subunit RPP1 [Halarchaeum solikamskense]